MATTTNFGWETPDDTDLVKDGAAAVRTLGSAIDTSLVDLKGGTTGQILSKNSNTDMDFTWIANDQGDITGVTAGVGITGGGTSGTVTVTNSMADAITTKGDLIVGTGADTFARLGAGTNDYVLTAASGETTGLKWAAPAAGGKILQVVQGTLTSLFSTTSTSLTDTGLSVSITPSSSSSKIAIFASGYAWVAGSGAKTENLGQFSLLRTTTQLQANSIGYYNLASSTAGEMAAPINFSYVDSPSTTSATTYKIQAKVTSAATTTVYLNGSSTIIASIIAMEIGA